MQVPPKKFKSPKGYYESDEESSGVHEDEAEFRCPVCNSHIGYLGEVFGETSEDDDQCRAISRWETACEAFGGGGEQPMKMD